MRGWKLGADSPVNSVLAIGAHSDDIEIGAGGTLRWICERFPNVRVRWVVLCASGERRAEARRSAESILGKGSNRAVETHEFRDGFFPYDGAGVKDTFESLKDGIAPDVIFTHHGSDMHQDHRLVSELTWNTFRDHVILEYEVPKYDGGLGSPNFFVPLTNGIVEKKVGGLIDHFGTQRSKVWFTRETFLGLMRLRGVECRSPSGYAEGFYVRKAVWHEGSPLQP